MLEREVADMRREVHSKDSDSAARKVGRIEEEERLEAEAASLERQVGEASASAARITAEVRALFATVQFAFHATGCDAAFDPVTLQALGGESPAAPTSPIRAKTAALKMYTDDTVVRAEVRSSISAGTLPAFIGIIENHAADLIQQYAAVMSTGGLAEGDLTRRFISPAALGPSRPPGRLKESVTSSALMAALGADVVAADAANGEEDEDSVRPLSMDALKRLASSSSGTDKNYHVMRSAANTAANVLTRGQNA